ncbi:MAG: ATP-dependent DNA helicase RecG [Candidatus Azotimanducaceae bacterium]|jgi:ATP-dependent DNA helicase RecG
MPTTLDQANVTSLSGVGPALAVKLAKLGIETLQDILFHLPLRYEDRTKTTPIGALQPGTTALIEGEVLACDVVFGRRRSLLAKIQDETGTLTIRFFHFSRAQQTNLSNHPAIRCFGEVRRGAAGLEMYHPEYDHSDAPLETSLTPVYPSTEGLTQQRFRKIVAQVLELMDKGRVISSIGEQYVELQTPDINQALITAHAPSPDVDLEVLAAGTHPALARLAFEELLSHHLSMRKIKQQAQRLAGKAFHQASPSQVQFLHNLGFSLTGAQLRVVGEIENDLHRAVPMLRLVQGDVGSGKTVVAALASLLAHDNDYQTVIMAPTEILSEQHFLNFSEWLTPLGIDVAWLTGKIKGKKQAETLALLENGTASVIIGTHALFQESVRFKNLGLVIIDEQHRFGVHQRLALRQKGADNGRLPHQLVMTATPIPRTLTMSLYADMDVSVIDELPPGRMPITTTVLPDSRRSDVIQRVEAACKEGNQTYWVCTLIDESEVLQCQAAEVTAQLLTEVLTSLKVGLIHGRMKAQDKSDVMSAFKAGEIDLLVATTVIEVGVDVPNASLMVIENPERLGLAQLHQLRGRIGRGSKESFCLLLYHPPLGAISKQRLNVMRESQDGFFIAEQDLKIRGPGEIFGSRQSGELQFRLADLVRDGHMLDDIRSLADKILLDDSDTAEALMDRWLTMPEIISQV